ncbi:MAG: hypothetical protein WD875_00820 [Pirellulales bacterium]
MRLTKLSQMVRKFSSISFGGIRPNGIRTRLATRHRRSTLETLEARLALDAATDSGTSSGSGSSTTAPTLLTLVVSTTIDEVDGDYSPGDLSLREAVILANAHDGNAVIELPSGVYTLTIPRPSLNEPDASGALTGDLDIDNDLGSIRIVGQGAATTIIDGNGLDRVFTAGFGELQLSHMTIRCGEVPSIGVNPSDLNGSGGGILVFGHLHLDNSVIEANRASYGGGLYLRHDASITMVDTIVCDNSAIQGGGIWFQEDAAATISGSEFADNTATEFGDGLFLLEPVVHLSDSAVHGNTAGVRGGGFYLGSAYLDVRTTNISDNFAGERGGGLYLSDEAGLSISQSTIFANRTDDAGLGGGLYAYRADVNMNEVTVSDNSVGDGGSGGGLYIEGVPDDESTTIVASTIINNSATNGGGITVAGGVAVAISDTSFTANTATVAGGGLLTTNLSTTFPAAPSITLDNVQFVGNTAAYGAGLCNGNNQSLTLTNSLIADNTATQQGGGAINDGGYLRLENTTVRGNRIEFFSTETGAERIGAGLLNQAVAADATLVVVASSIIENSIEVNAVRGAIVSGAGIANLSLPPGGSEVRTADLVIESSTIARNTLLGVVNPGDHQFDSDAIASGAGLYSYGETGNRANVWLTNSTVDDNHAAVRATTGVYLDDLSVGAHGGGIYAESSNVTIVSSSISRNSVQAENDVPNQRASVDGGGIDFQFDGDATLRVVDSTINGNEAGGDLGSGGGIHAIGEKRVPNESELAISGSTIEGNSAPAGGGIAIADNINAFISHTDINSNAALVTGGGLLVVSNPTSLWRGGLPIALDNVHVVDNTATYGAGLSNGNNQSLILTNSLVADNVATEKAGGVFNDGGYLSLTDSEIRGNRVVGLGGEDTPMYGAGVLNQGIASNALLEMANVRVVGNLLDSRVPSFSEDDYLRLGAGIANLAGLQRFAIVDVANSVIADNEITFAAETGAELGDVTGKGGGIYSYASPNATARVFVERSTISDNRVALELPPSQSADLLVSGGGIHVEGGSDLTGYFQHNFKQRRLGPQPERQQRHDCRGRRHRICFDARVDENGRQSCHDLREFRLRD